MHVLVVSAGTKGHSGWHTYTKQVELALKEDGYTVEKLEISSPLRLLTNPLLAPLLAWKHRRTITAPHIGAIFVTVEPLVHLFAFLPTNILNKVLLTVHGSYGVRLFEKAYRKRTRKVLQSIAACIAVSEYTKKRLLEEAVKYNLDLTKKTHVIKNTIALPKDTTRKKTKTHQVICIGELKPRKGILEALKGIAAYTKNSKTDVMFTIIGSYKEDAYFREVKQLIASLGLEKNVKIKGEASDKQVSTYLRSADVLLMPAKTTHDTFEGYGLVYIEANAYGVPVIGPETSGAAEAICNGKTGYTVDPEDEDAIARALINILDKEMITQSDCKAWAKTHSGKTASKTLLNLLKAMYSES